MNNDLKITVTASLNIGKSIGEINDAIRGIEQKVKKLKLKIEVDEKVFNTLKSFTNELNKISDVAKNTGKVIRETLNPDGSRVKETFFNGLDGEFKRTTIEAKKTTESLKEQENQVDFLNSKYKNLTQTINQLDEKGNVVGSSLTFKNDTGTRSQMFQTDKDGNVLGGSKETINYDKELKIEQQKKEARKKLEESYNQWWLKSLKEREIAEQKSNQKLIDEMSRGREKAIQKRQQEDKKLAIQQANSSNKNIELIQKEKQAQEELNKEIQRQLYFYQETKKLQAQDLTRRYADAVDKNVLGNQVAKLDVDPSSFQSLKQLKDWQDDIDLGFKKISSTVKSSSSHVLTFGEALKTAMVKFPIWMVASTAFFQSLRFFSDGIAYVNDLNKALTEISVVTGLNQQQVAELGQEYSKLATEMGVLTSEVARASVEFYRQGLSQEEVMKRVSTATQYAKISNLDFKQSSEILTATVNSMGVSIERAADVYSYLGDATATGADEIGIAYQKLGGSASAVNLEFEKGASWIAVLSARTREGASTIGQSIKSILARVQSLKENGFAEEDGTSVNEVAKALSKVNIQLMDSSGNFRNFGSVMDELGDKWKDIDSRTRAYLATTIAGNYQQSRFQNLMEGYADTIPLYEQALQSAGNTQQKFDQYLQGTEAHLNKLVTTWHGLWQSAFDSEAIRTGIDLLTSVATGVKNVVDAFGIIPPVLTTAGMAFFLFNGGLKTTMINGELVLNTLRGLPVGFKTLDSSMSATILKTRLLNGTLTTLSATANMTKRAVVGAMTFTAGAVLPVAGFLALGLAIQKLTENLLEAKQAQEQVRKEQENMMNSYKSRKEDVQSLANEFERLSKVQNERKFNVDEEKRFTELQNELGKILPTVVSGLDNKGNSLIESSEAIREQIGVLEELIQLEKDKARLDAPSKLKEGYSKIDELKEQLKYEQDVIESKKEQQKVLLDDKDHTRAEALAVEQDIQEWLIKQKITQTQINAEAKKNAENFKVFFDGMKLDDSVVKQVTEIMSAFDLGGKDIGQIEGVVLSVVDAVKQLNIAMDSGNAEGIKEAKENLDGIITTYAKGKVNTNEFTNALDKNTDSQNSNNQAKSEASQKQSELNKHQEESISTTERLVGITEKQLSTIQGAIATYQLLSAVESDSAVKSQELTDAITILSNAYPHLVNGKELNIEAIKKEVQANEVLMEAIDMLAQGKLTQEQTMSLIAAQQSKQRMEILNKELQFLQEVINKFNDVADGINAQGQKLSDRAVLEGEKLANRAVQKAAKIKVDLNVDTDKYNTQISSLAKSIDFKGYGVPDVKKTPKDKSSSSKSTKDPISQYVSDEYQKSVDAYNLKLEESRFRQEKLTESSAGYRKELSAQSTIYTSLMKLTDNEVKRLSARNATLNRSLSSMGSFNKLSDKQKEKYNDIKKEIDDNTKSITTLKKSTLDYQNSIDTNKIGILNSELSSLSEKLKIVDDKYTLSQKKQSLMIEGSSAYAKETRVQNTLLAEKESLLKQQIAQLDGVIKKEKLSAKVAEEYKQQLSALNIELLDTQKSLFDKRSEAATEAIDVLKKSIEMERDLKVAAVEEEIRLLDKAHDKKMEQYDEDIRAFEDNINRKLRLLDDQESQDSFNKDIGKLQQDKLAIDKRINRLMLDDSQEAIAKRTELEQQSRDIQEEIEKRQHDRQVDLRKQNLQDELDVYKDEVDQKKKAEQDKYEAQKDSLEKQLDNINYYYNEMLQNEQYFANLHNQILTGNVANLKNKLNEFLSEFKSKNKDAIQEIGMSWQSIQNLKGNISDTQSNLDSVNPSSGKSNPLGMSEADFKRYVWNKERYINNTNREQAKEENARLRERYNISEDNYSLEELKKYIKFHEGGIVGGGGNRLTQLANKLFNNSPNEQTVVALRKELFAPEKNMPNFFNNLRNFTSSILSQNQSPAMAGVNVNINIDNFHGTEKQINTLENRLVNTLKNLGKI